MRIRIGGGVDIPTVGTYTALARIHEEVDVELPELGPILLGIGSVQDVGNFLLQRIHGRLGLHTEIEQQSWLGEHTHLDAAIVLNIGVAFPHDDGEGLNVILQALPLHGAGKIVLRAYDPNRHEAEETEKQATVKKTRAKEPA